MANKRDHQFGDSDRSHERSAKGQAQQSQQHFAGEYLGGNPEANAHSAAKGTGKNFELDKKNDLGAHAGHDARYKK